MFSSNLIAQSFTWMNAICLTGYYEDDFDDYNMGYGGMGYVGNRGRGGMRPPRGRMQGMMIDDRPRGGQPGSHYMSKTGHSVHMRGMPFLAIDQDVFDVSIKINPFYKPSYQSFISWLLDQDVCEYIINPFTKHLFSHLFLLWSCYIFIK